MNKLIVMRDSGFEYDHVRGNTKFNIDKMWRRCQDSGRYALTATGGLFCLTTTIILL